MRWSGFGEVAAFASKWKLNTECRLELAALLQAEYNAGANDVLEYFQLQPDKEKRFKDN